MVEVVNLPKRNDEAKKGIQEFLDEVKGKAEENEVTQALVIMMDEKGQVAVSASGDYIDIMGMIAIAMKEL